MTVQTKYGKLTDEEAREIALDRIFDDPNEDQKKLIDAHEERVSTLEIVKTFVEGAESVNQSDEV